jgi:hypothetical protein
MRKAFSILLICCFLSYHFGYYLVYMVYQHQVEQKWKHRVYQDGFGEQMMMRVPMKLPYVFDQEDYQLTNISFKKDGFSYRVIKKRFVEDAFELIYVPDKDKIKLEINFRSWVITMVPNGSRDGNGEKVLSKSTLKDYLPSSVKISKANPTLLFQISPVYPNECYSGLFPVPTPPPPQFA